MEAMVEEAALPAFFVYAAACPTQKRGGVNMGLSSIDDSFDLSSLVQTTNLTTVIQVVINTFTINHMSLPSII